MELQIKSNYIGMTNADLITFCNQAVADWNYAVQNGSNLNFSFSRVYSTSQSTINFWGEYQPAQSWYGKAVMYRYNEPTDPELLDEIRLGQVPYDYADCLLNVYHLDANYVTTTRAHWREIAAHEMGHALGLAHTTNKGTLMYHNFRESTAIGPTADEVVGVDSLYG